MASMNRKMNSDTRPLITVLLPSLNVAPFMAQCLSSVIHQTYGNLEIVCIDAGSTDGTLEIIENYALKDDRIRIIHSDRKSYGYQMNIGIRQAHGDYVGIVETDDFVEPDFYEKMIQHINVHPDIVKCNSARFKNVDGLIIKKNFRYLGNLEYGEFNDPDKIQKLPLCDGNIWNGIYKRDFLIDNRILFNETPGAAFQDIGFKHQVFFYAKKAFYIDEALYDYRLVREGQSTWNPKCIEYTVEEYRRLFDHFSYFKESEPVSYYVLWICMLNAFWGEICKMVKKHHINDPVISRPYGWLVDFVDAHADDYQVMLGQMDQFHAVEIDLMVHSLTSFAEYRHAADRIQGAHDRKLTESVGDSHVVIVGNGIRGKNLYNRLFDCDIPIDAYADNDSTKWSSETNISPEVMSPQMAADRFRNDVFFIANKNHERELRNQLSQLGIGDDQIIIWHP